MEALRLFLQRLGQRCDEIESILRRLRAQRGKKSNPKAPAGVAESQEVTEAGTSPEIVLPVGLQKSEPQPGSTTG
jgi:hypothetical protein